MDAHTERAVADVSAFVEAVTETRKYLAKVSDPDRIDAAESELLGRKSLLVLARRQLGNLPSDIRKQAGRRVNEARDRLQQAVDEARSRVKAELRVQSYETDRLDLTERLISQRQRRGSLHLITQARDHLEDIFVGMGFTVAEGPEVESAWYNYEALNIPEWHPARGSFDTLFVDLGEPEEVMLRSHNSPVQIRTMEACEPPIYIVAPGRAFRRDTADATHLPTFNQIEGLVVDHDITMADLAGTVDEFVKAFFGREVDCRLRPSHFPFTEPSAEFDVSRPDGSWLELGGCGMVHPDVLRNCEVDPEVWQGFAFGFGIDRLVAIRYQLEDIRELANSDVRFLRQFQHPVREVLL
ncbi:MAG: phenylalanine--tRNA ligase subunit alpha [Acidimicrobiaceae bacterium]|nr:phenylalanine--tRNA ligase subunit alpha [Acidimicrobiaceae bacterium]